MFSFNSRKQTFQAVQRCISFGIENLTEIFNGVGDVPDGFGPNGTALMVGSAINTGDVKRESF